jgi:hypothetical protein
LEQAMKKVKIPKTDSIKELAKFFETHDSSEFEDELVEITEPIFVPRNSVLVRLRPEQVSILKALAKRRGISADQLVREWIVQRISTANGRRVKHGAIPKARKPG